MTRGLVSTASTIIVIIYIVGAGRWVATDADWYRSLNSPAWQPPDFIFGLIWPYNFAMLIIAGFVVASRDSRTEQIIWLASLALSVTAAVLCATFVASIWFRSRRCDVAHAATCCRRVSRVATSWSCASAVSNLGCNRDITRLQLRSPQLAARTSRTRARAARETASAVSRCHLKSAHDQIVGRP